MLPIYKTFKPNFKDLVKHLNLGEIVIIKKKYNKSYCKKIINFLTNIGKNSLTSYHPIKLSSPNYYRVNFDDHRSHVKGFFHQFNFFPWNQDQFDFFKFFEESFILKNKINNLEDRKFFSPKDNKDCTIRLSFQFYPAGKGYLNMHSDPVDYHQKYLFMLSLSSKKKDFKSGGLQVKVKNKIIDVDQFTDTGDLVVFKADLKHGVKIIDKNKKYNPISFKGRWMVIFSTNKLIDNKKIRNSK